MAKLWEYAALSDDVYNFNQKKDIKRGFYLPQLECIRHSWCGFPYFKKQQEMQQPKMRYGFFARLYKNIFTHETIISIRGTLINNQGNWWDDANIATKSWDNACQQAINYYLWACNFLSRYTQLSYPPKLTGHSLGGYLAQIVLAEFPSSKAVIFNAPKLDNIIIPKYDKANNCLFDFSAQCLSYLPHNAKPVFLNRWHLNNSYIYIKNHDPLFQNNLINIDVEQDIIHNIGKAQGTCYTLKGKKIDYCPDKLKSIPLLGIYAYKKYAYHSIDNTLKILKENKKLAEKQF